MVVTWKQILISYIVILGLVFTPSVFLFGNSTWTPYLLLALASYVYTLVFIIVKPTIKETEAKTSPSSEPKVKLSKLGRKELLGMGIIWNLVFSVVIVLGALRP
jgi:hypothetical protein